VFPVRYELSFEISFIVTHEIAIHKKQTHLLVREEVA
jgi:hypothetical protein